MPNALITGIRGQDGAYLAKLLLDKGYKVWGAVRLQTASTEVSGEIGRAEREGISLPALKALDIADDVRLVTVDYLQIDSLARVIDISAPNEIYNLAAQSSVARSFEAPTETGEITGLGVARLLHAVRQVNPQARFYQASSSEMFGSSRETPQNENTPFYPRSPYGAAKVYAHCMTINYREAFNLYACNGILFNHESPLRPEKFVTRKICSAVARIKMGMQRELVLGNIEIERDWGFAGDYVEAMHLMLQQDEAQDYIIATGKTHSLREFVELAFNCVGLDYHDWVRTDSTLYRPSEVNAVVGDARRARERLGWHPKVSFSQLVEFLVEVELKRARGEEHLVHYFPSGLPRQN
ncbi:GDP-mannose 4,6-dehydratase [Abditibacteriota bacterium]|nr:GDP-mannose 4,6-dehydratase [Abditibacteriota bacterium]